MQNWKDTSQDFKDSTFGKIPRSWSVKTLLETVGNDKSSIVAGPFGSNLKVSDYRNEGVPIIRLQNIERNQFVVKDIQFISPKKAEELAYHSFQGGDIVLAKLGDPVGKACIVPEQFQHGIVVSDVVRIRVDESRVNKSFLTFLLNSDTVVKQLNSDIIGTTRPRLNLDQIRDILLPLPPKEDQDNIAELLNAIDQAIEQTEQIIAKYQRIKTGLMQDLLTRGIDEQGNIRSEETHEFKDSPFGRIPKEWEIKQCYEVCREIVVGIVIKPAQYYVEEGIPLLRSLNILENKINFSEFKYISTENNLLNKKSMLRKGDVLTVRTGYPGTTSIIPEELVGANCVDLLISRPLDVIIPEYYSLWINSSFGKKQISNMQGGLAQQHFNVTELKKLLIAFPVVKEQKKIVVKMKIIDRKIEDEQTYFTKLQKTKTGLMQDLLTGKVRVNYKD